MNYGLLTFNRGVFGGAISTFGGATIQNTVCNNNIAVDGGCWVGLSENNVEFIRLSANNNTAQYGGVFDVYGPFFDAISSQFVNNTASIAGGVIFSADSTGSMANNLFIGNTAPQGEVFYSERFLRSDPLVFDYSTSTMGFDIGPHAATTTTGNVNPLASSTAPTGSAFYASGVTLFITDTIVSGYSLDLETGTAPSSTIVGDYNLFDQTPVISDTGITTGTHSIVGNPLFADNLGHLSAGSPAINHGIDVGIYTDLDGNPRPSGGGFDIGAYQYVAAVVKLFLPLVRR